MENSQIKFYYRSAQSPDEVFLPLGMESSNVCAHRGHTMCAHADWEKSSLHLVHQGSVESAFPHHTRMTTLLEVIEQQVENRGS